MKVIYGCILSGTGRRSKSPGIADALVFSDLEFWDAKNTWLHHLREKETPLPYKGEEIVIRCLKWLIRHRTITVLVCLLLILPACIGLTASRAHYDLISAMPETYDSVMGSRILQDEFGKGAFSMILTEGLSQAEEYQLEQRLRSIEHVQCVLGYASATGGMLPSEFLPESVRAAVEQGDRRLIAVFFDESASSEGVMHAVEKIRKEADGQCRIAGAAAWIADLRALAEGHRAQILLVTAALCLLVLIATTDSFLLPFLFLFCSSAGIVWNLGLSSLLIRGSGYVKELAAVFQTGLCSGFSVFLWKAYKEKREHNPNLDEAMAQAVGKTARSVIGAGLVTASAACMLLRIPLVPVQEFSFLMISAVILSWITSLLFLPCMIRMLESAVRKTEHRVWMPDARILARFNLRHARKEVIAFLAVLAFALYGCLNGTVRNDLVSMSHSGMPSEQAAEQLRETFDVQAVHLLLVNRSVPEKDLQKLTQAIQQTDGVKTVYGGQAFMENGFAEMFLHGSALAGLKSDEHQLILVESTFAPGSEEISRQIDRLREYVKDTDPKAVLLGEAAETEDLIRDVRSQAGQILLLFILAALVVLAMFTKSVSLPMVTMAVVMLTGAAVLTASQLLCGGLPLVLSMTVLLLQPGCIMCGAIELTERYRENRKAGKARREAVSLSVKETAVPVMASGAAMTAAMLGAGMTAGIESVSVMLLTMACAVTVSTLGVLFLLPALLILLDRGIMQTTAL